MYSALVLTLPLQRQNKKNDSKDMTKRNDLKQAWRALRAQRDKARMSKINHLGVMNSKNNFYPY